MKKLYELHTAANNLQPHEDRYNFNIKIVNGKEFTSLLTIEHEYVNKTANHPISTVYSRYFNEINDEILLEIKDKLIKRQLELIAVRETECSKRLEEYRRANQECADRIVHLEGIKKI